MFKPREIVVCVDKEVNYGCNDGRMDGLTIGKKYHVKFIKYHYSYQMIYIFNDHLSLESYYDYRFITLTTHRKQKLEKICSKLTT